MAKKPFDEFLKECEEHKAKILEKHPKLANKYKSSNILSLEETRRI